MSIYINKVIHKNFVDPNRLTTPHYNRKVMPNYVVLRGISTLVKLVVAPTECLVSQVLYSTRRYYVNLLASDLFF